MSVEMTGRAEWTTGPTKDSGPVKLTANVNGENKAEFDLSNGTRIAQKSSTRQKSHIGLSDFYTKEPGKL